MTSDEVVQLAADRLATKHPLGEDRQLIVKLVTAVKAEQMSSAMNEGGIAMLKEALDVAAKQMGIDAAKIAKLTEELRLATDGGFSD